MYIYIYIYIYTSANPCIKCTEKCEAPKGPEGACSKAGHPNENISIYIYWSLGGCELSWKPPDKAGNALQEVCVSRETEVIFPGGAFGAT